MIDIDEDHERCVVNTPEGTTIDVPHTPEAEAALIQEVRERLSHLELHLVLPEHVGALQQLNEDLYAVMRTVAETEDYECGHMDSIERLFQ